MRTTTSRSTAGGTTKKATRPRLAHALAAELTPLGGPCAALRFFEPMPEFYVAMERFLGCTVYDVGAGQGHLAFGLANMGHKVRALDIRTEGAPFFRVTLANAVTFRYQHGSVCLLARPCHGAYFVEPSVTRMLECGVRAIGYIGLAKNARADLGRHRGLFRCVAAGVGVERERFYLYDRARP